MKAVRSAVLLALVAGCGFDVRPGQAAVDGGTLDGSQTGDGMIDSSIDGMTDSTIPFVDSDGDSIADSQDNCVNVPNTNQRNHDGDPFGDACDRCPHLASQTDPDQDNDGVGDDCDPRPSTPGDTQVLWAGFYEASEIAGWGGQGAFSVANGYLVQTATNTSGWAPGDNVDVPFVMTEVVIDDLLETNGSLGIAVTTPTNAQFECTVAKTGSNVFVRSRQQGGDSDSATWPGQFASGARITFRIDLRTNITCRATQGNVTVQQDSGRTSAPRGRTFLGTEGIAARFDYLFVVNQGS